MSAPNQHPEPHFLKIENLKVQFHTSRGTAKAVDGVSLHVDEGETLGIVGESGCGKSVTALSVLGLIPEPTGKITDGKILFEGDDLLTYTENQMQGIRGKQISMVFQEPMTSLNPVFTIGFQLSEMFRLHLGVSRKEARERSINLLRLVHIPAPEKRIDEYPHELSGGMQQRVMIAMALACNPRLLIADEPTTALDVTIQAQILELMQELQAKLNMAVILITHDLGVVASAVERILVMYAGKVVEEGDVFTIFENPQHPYTRGLLKAVPRIEHDSDRETERLYEIKGVVPSLYRLPGGCNFYPRCFKRTDQCRLDEPALKRISPTHAIRCWV